MTSKIPPGTLKGINLNAVEFDDKCTKKIVFGQATCLGKSNETLKLPQAFSPPPL